MGVSRQEKVLFETLDRFGIVTLNRPEVLNALDLEMVRLIHAQLVTWQDDPSILGVVFRGAGPKAFCAGGDIRAMYASRLEKTPVLGRFFDEEYALDCLIHRYPKQTVALMDGVVMGGGMGIGQGCQVRVMTERTRVAMPETLIGMFPDVGASYFLARIMYPLALYIGMTGDTLSGRDAFRCGLADVLLPSEQLDDLPVLLERVQRGSLKDAVSAPVVSSSVPDVLSLEVSHAVERHFSSGDAAAIMASLMTEQGVSECNAWIEATLGRMRRNSPLMMQVTYEQLRRGRSLALEACFAMERTMMRHCFEHGDAMEGIRALAIDKDHAPSWQHRSVKEVTPEEVERFFNEEAPIPE